MSNTRHNAGFSLIEVNLAIFVISIGMLTLFSLFPAGLRQVEASHASTQEALFADYVLSTVRAESRLVSSAAWLDMNSFRAAVLENLDDIQHGGIHRMSFGEAAQFMRYELSIAAIGNSRRSITLWCKAQEFGPTGNAFRQQASQFYTEVVYSGMP